MRKNCFIINLKKKKEKKGKKSEEKVKSINVSKSDTGSVHMYGKICA